MSRLFLLLLLCLTACAFRTNDDRLADCRTKFQTVVKNLGSEQGCVGWLLMVDYEESELRMDRPAPYSNEQILAPMLGLPMPANNNSAPMAPKSLSSNESAPAAAVTMPNYNQFNQNTTVVAPGGCIGAVVNGICHGTPAAGSTMTCHGQMLNGMCTGPMF